MPARISVVFWPVVAVTLPVTDPAAACAAAPRCCANPGLAQTKMANSSAPQSGYHAPSLSLRHNFNATLHDRTGHDDASNLGLTSRCPGAVRPGKPNKLSCCRRSFRLAAGIRNRSNLLKGVADENNFNRVNLYNYF